jgi:autotransporter-associated beta strand protein
MKQITRNTSRLVPVLAAGLALGLLADQARAATQYYFDVDGANPGFGISEGSSYSWDDPNWSTDSTGSSATANWPLGGFARFTGGFDYTVTLNNSETNAGLYYNYNGAGAATLVLNAAGSGQLSLVKNPTLTAGLPVQGFFTGGGDVTINTPIVGPGGVSQSSGGGALRLYGVNTYSGGTVFSSSATSTYVNNNSSFGTGPVNINNTTYAPIIPTGGTTITLANNWTNFTSAGVLFGADTPNTPCLLTGPWAMQGFYLNLRNNGDSSSPLTLQGVISGTGGSFNLSANNNGTIILKGANTFSGLANIGGTGNSGMTVQIYSFNKVSGGSASSSLGHPTTVANGTIAIGGNNFNSTLLYSGTGETTDRIINLAGATGGATLQNDGSGPITFSSAFTYAAGPKTLTLQGSNTGANTIGAALTDTSAGAIAVVKSGAGTWKLVAANTYTGGTTINQGTLEISGSLAGSVVNWGGTLTLDNSSALASNATVNVMSGSPVNLNFTGTIYVNTLIIDGNPAFGLWGPSGSAAPHTSGIFQSPGNTGYIYALGKPVIVTQPVSGSVFVSQPFSFAVEVSGDLSAMTYQWKKNGSNIPGANTSSYNISAATTNDAGVYTCAVTNGGGGAVSANAYLFVSRTNAYTETIRADNPMSFWRLDETNGTLAYDLVGGNMGQYNNVLLNQTGYSLTDSDPGIGLPGNPAAGRGYVVVTNYTPYAFVGIPAFTLEAWAYFTNLTGVQRIASTFALSGGNGWAFGINGANGLRFTTGTVQDADVTFGTSLVTGVWYHLVCTCDGSYYYFYVNGNPVGSVRAVTGNNGTSQPLTLGCNPVAYTNSNTGDPLAEQVRGRLDEVAIYGGWLDDAHVLAHFKARYLDSGLPVPSMPVVTPATNYATLTTALQENAAGVDLSYQWYKAPATPLNGRTGSSITLSPLQLSDAGSYYVKVSNSAGITNSPTNYVAVLPIPSSGADLNLTNGLVLHLPFDGDYKDISGRGNNGTSVGAPTFVTDGIIGGKALHYFTDTTLASTNYVTLGVPADLQFGSSTDFTVSYWVRQPVGSTFTNLPFFATMPVGGATGWMFSPYATATTWGGWYEALGTMTSPSIYTSFPDSGLINDFTWHHLVHSAQRSANVTTYLDGVQVDSQAIGFLGSLSSTTAANIGQDSSGAYAVSAAADIDDVAVWNRTVSPFEVSGMYLGGKVNHLSVAQPVAPPLTATTITSVTATNLSYTGGSGTHFVLLGTTNAAASMNTWSRLLTNPATPGSFTFPASGHAAMFYRVSSEN